MLRVYSPVVRGIDEEVRPALEVHVQARKDGRHRAHADEVPLPPRTVTPCGIRERYTPVRSARRTWERVQRATLAEPRGDLQEERVHICACLQAQSTDRSVSARAPVKEAGCAHLGDPRYLTATPCCHYSGAMNTKSPRICLAWRCADPGGGSYPKPVVARRRGLVDSSLHFEGRGSTTAAPRGVRDQTAPAVGKGRGRRVGGTTRNGLEVVHHTLWRSLRSVRTSAYDERYAYVCKSGQQTIA